MTSGHLLGANPSEGNANKSSNRTCSSIMNCWNSGESIQSVFPIIHLRASLSSVGQPSTAFLTKGSAEPTGRVAASLRSTGRVILNLNSSSMNYLSEKQDL